MFFWGWEIGQQESTVTGGSRKVTGGAGAVLAGSEGEQRASWQATTRVCDVGEEYAEKSG